MLKRVNQIHNLYTSHLIRIQKLIYILLINVIASSMVEGYAEACKSDSLIHKHLN
jgi:hypothetical protein